MKKRLQSIANNTLFRYIFIGGTAYVIEISSLYLLISQDVNEILAVAITFWLGLIIAFVLQKVFTFKNTTKHVRHLTRQSTYYIILVGFNYLITLFAVSILSPLLGVLLSRTIILLITTGWNFIIYKKVIFKEIK